jgi:hypothetical protein
MGVPLQLARDLVDCQGRVLARAGEEITPGAVEEVARRTRPAELRPLSASLVLEDVREPYGDPAYKHLFRLNTVQSTLARALLAAELPLSLHEELRRLRDEDWSLYRHGLITAAVALRMLLAVVGEARGLPELAAAALLHDLGMRHLRPGAIPGGGSIEPAGAREIAAHPLLGAWHLAAALGRHPAVDAALGHHWRRGRGYPALPAPPPRSVEVMAVASAFAALTQERAYRSVPFDARGAADVLVADAGAGEADREAVQLLVHALRGAHGDPRRVVFGLERLGRAPGDNRHRPIAPML